MTSNLRYTCENPDCLAAGTRYDIPKDSEAACPTCGWMMYGHWLDGEPGLEPA
jgi:hypothetical protein